MESRGDTQARLHLGIAEQGKLHALRGETSEALRHFREATRLAVSTGAPEVFVRHYTQCVLETLERTGAFDEVLAFCERAEAHYEANPPPNELAVLDLATHRQRRGVVLLKAGRTAEARQAFDSAVQTAGRGKLPLAEAVGRWLATGLRVDTRRLEAEQRRHAYFIVREDAVDPSRAVALPDGMGVPGYRPS